MFKRILMAIPVASLLLFSPIQQPANASDAFCVIKDAEDEIAFRGDCIFQQFGGNGSFSIEAREGLIAGARRINVYITERNVAEVRGMTTRGVNARWGQAKRSRSDSACWIGSDFEVCAY